jgi:hypothetical protein
VARSAAFAQRIDAERGRDILNAFVRSPHRHDPRAASRSVSFLAWKIR